jgi:TolB-like protein/Tfp pilus assembly protein PilF
MVREDGVVKLLDFGLAKSTVKAAGHLDIDAEASTRALVSTNPGVIMGTVSYMSPEQARGLQVDERTDVWSLGVVLYEMISGKVPFAGETVTDVIANMIWKDPLALTLVSDEATERLDEIVQKALAKDREERYQTAKDMLIDLKKLKRRLEVQAEIERTQPPEADSGVKVSTSGGRTGVETTHMSAARTASMGAPPTSSAEYIVTEIRQHRRGVIIALCTLILATLSAAYFFHFVRKAKAIDSIAILPLMNASNDPDTEYLSDGITESIINSLSQLPNLKVMARTTVFRYKGQSSDPQKVGRDLGVEAVLTGKVLQRGNTLVVQADLVNVSDGSELWGQQYKLSDALAVQEEIAKEISANLRLKLSGEQQSRVTKHYTENPEAYQLYLKGRFYWNKRTGEALKKAIEYFNQAIEKDPTYALAYAGLADAYGLSPFYSTDAPQEAFPKAKAVAKKALELDETLAEAHTSLAPVLSIYDWNFPESNREFQRAIELNPNYATAHHWYGGINLAALGRFDEAIAEMKRAQELDPLSSIINADLGETYFEARQYDRSIEQLRKTVEMDQSFYYAHYHLGMAYEMKGSFSEAIAEYYKARQLNDDPRVLAFLGHAFAVSGKRDDALKTLDQLKEISRQRYVQAYNFAIVYAGLGEKDKAFQWLERSYQEHAPRMMRLKVDPFLDNLRSDPRFDDLVRRIGLSP